MQTIEDPRAAQGASLKGCPVCGGGFYVLSLSCLDPGRCRSLMLFLQVWAMAFPTVQSSRILSGGRWPPTERRTILAGTERLCLLSSCNPIYCVVTLIVVVSVMLMRRVAWNIDRSHGSTPSDKEVMTTDALRCSSLHRQAFKMKIYVVSTVLVWDIYI